MWNIELYAQPNEYFLIRIGQKEFRFKLLYKILTNCISLNLKKNIFFRMKSDEFALLNNFKDADFSLFNRNGFDKESIKSLDSVISKINKLYNSRRLIPYISFYSKDEHKKLKDLHKNFYDKIFYNSDGAYQYDKYKLPIYSFDCNVLYNKHGLHLLSDYSLLKIKDADIIDAGAYIGDSALVLSEYTNGNVYSFECCSEQYELIKKTIDLNEKNNIIPVKAGLGEEKSECEINIYSSNTCNSIISNRNMVPLKKEKVKITTLDEYVKENNIKVGLIKSDIEGMEPSLIKGAIETIKKFKPVLIISIYHSPEDFCNIKTMIDNLNLGYEFKLYKPIDGCVINDTVLIAQIPS